MVANVTDAVAVGIELVEVVVEGAVVAVVTEAVPIGVEIGVGGLEDAEIAIVDKTVMVELVGLEDPNAVVAGVAPFVAVVVELV